MTAAAALAACGVPGAGDRSSRGMSVILNNVTASSRATGDSLNGGGSARNRCLPHLLEIHAAQQQRHHRHTAAEGREEPYGNECSAAARRREVAVTFSVAAFPSTDGDMKYAFMLTAPSVAVVRGYCGSRVRIR